MPLYVLTVFLIGIAMGFLTGVPIGPVNVAVIDAAFRHTVLRAMAVGLGGAFGDGLYAFLGIRVVGPYLIQNPVVTPILQAFSGLVLIGYGWVVSRSRPMEPAPGEGHEVKNTRELLAGFILGFSLIVLNPGAIVTWILVVGIALGDVNQAQGNAAALGVFAGSLMWFSMVGYLTHRGRNFLGDKSKWIPRIVGWLLIIYGFYSLSLCVRYFLLH